MARGVPWRRSPAISENAPWRLLHVLEERHQLGRDQARGGQLADGRDAPGQASLLLGDGLPERLGLRDPEAVLLERAAPEARHARWSGAGRHRVDLRLREPVRLQLRAGVSRLLLAAGQRVAQVDRRLAGDRPILDEGGDALQLLLRDGRSRFARCRSRAAVACTSSLTGFSTSAVSSGLGREMGSRTIVTSGSPAFTIEPVRAWIRVTIPPSGAVTGRWLRGRSATTACTLRVRTKSPAPGLVRR